MNKALKIQCLILVISLLVCMISSIALAEVKVTVDGIGADTSGELPTAVKTPAEAILGIITLVAGAVAVGMLIYIGIKYMTKGAGGRAEVKDTLLPYLIGAILIGGASALAQTAIKLGSGGGGGGSTPGTTDSRTIIRPQNSPRA